jgi:hypothetical protein
MLHTETEQQSLKSYEVGCRVVVMPVGVVSSDWLADPEAYLREVLTRNADHPINRIDELLSPLSLAVAIKL